ncbi:MAG TPA: S8 family serine peptidase [Verrucomicrobiae bacterium]|jgi:thermitase
MRKEFVRQLILCLLLACGLTARAAEGNSIAWHRAADKVDADVQGEALLPLLGQIARDTGWQVYVEPGTSKTVSAKFKDLPSQDALRMLLGNLNFMLSPQTNGSSQLYVFSTVVQKATQLVPATKVIARHVPNQLLIKLKSGANIDAIAKLVGAKVIGRNDKMGVYLLQFADAASTDAALGQLQADSDVQAVDYNYVYDPPPAAQPLAASSVPQAPVSLTLQPQTANDPCDPIVGLIDTPIQSLGSSLDAFMLKPISVVSTTPVTPSATTLTHATGMAQAMMRGMGVAGGGSTSARILSVDVYGSNPTTTSWYVAEGLQAAVNNGATILNMSLGGSGDSTVLDSVIQQAIADGIPVFAAAGNNGVATPEYPAADSGVNAVTALQSANQLASYANYGSFVDMALPGASVVYLGNQPFLMQGTSVSTAYATGLATGTKSSDCGGWPSIVQGLAKSYPVPGK